MTRLKVIQILKHDFTTLIWIYQTKNVISLNSHRQVKLKTDIIALSTKSILHRLVMKVDDCNSMKMILHNLSLEV